MQPNRRVVGKEKIEALGSSEREGPRRAPPFMGYAPSAMQADEVQTEIFRRMTPAERWRAAERLYWSARNLKAAFLRSIHPEWTEVEVQRAVKEAFLHARG
jgi:hypothetical protein